MSASRRLIAGLVRLGLVVLTIVLVSGYVMRHVGSSRKHVRVETEVSTADSLGPGDMRLYNADSSVDLILKGNNILAGLSPKTVDKIKTALDTSAMHDTNGIGGSIAQIVKKSVAGAIGTHAVFPLSDIRDLRYEHDQIVFDWKDGGHHELFGSTRVNHEKVSNSFRPAEAQRFIDAVHARMNAGPPPPPAPTPPPAKP